MHRKANINYNKRVCAIGGRYVPLKVSTCFQRWLGIVKGEYAVEGGYESWKVKLCVVGGGYVSWKTIYSLQDECMPWNVNFCSVKGGYMLWKAFCAVGDRYVGVNKDRYRTLLPTGPISIHSDVRVEDFCTSWGKYGGWYNILANTGSRYLFAN